MRSSGKHVMNNSIHFILLSLGAKCLLNWALVFLQSDHICRSFVGLFSISLTVCDTAFTVIFTSIHLHGDGQFFLLGLHLTKYHICLLVQIIGEVYSVLQYPVVVMVGLDQFCKAFKWWQHATSTLKWIVRSILNTCLWSLALLYVFLLSDFCPVLEDVFHSQIHQCWILHDFRIHKVAVLVILILGAAKFFTKYSPPFIKNHPQENQVTDQSKCDSSRSVVSQDLCILNTWTTFLFFLAALLLLPVGIPSYLGLNVAWLCFLNSVLTEVASCVACPASELEQGLAAAPPDSF